MYTCTCVLFCSYCTVCLSISVVFFRGPLVFLACNNTCLFDNIFQLKNWSVNRILTTVNENWNEKSRVLCITFREISCASQFLFTSSSEREDTVLQLHAVSGLRERVCWRFRCLLPPIQSPPNAYRYIGTLLATHTQLVNFEAGTITLHNLPQPLRI